MSTALRDKIVKYRQLAELETVLRAREDPNAFTEYIMTDERTGKRFTQGEIHRTMHRLWSGHARCAIVKAREHGGSAQLRARILWEIGKNPNIRIKYVSATDELATSKVRVLKEMIEGEPRLQKVFPHLRQGESVWSDGQFTVIRHRFSPDPTVQARGVLASATGGRADLLVFDDATDERNSLAEPGKRGRVVQAVFETWLNLVTDPEKGGRAWWMSNVWHASDAAAEIRKRKTFQVLEAFVDDSLDPIWPEEWPRHRLLEHRETIGTLAFSRGFQGRPWDDAMSPVLQEWLHLYLKDELPRAEDALQLDIFVGVDLAISEKPTADWTGVVVVGRDDDYNVFVLEALRRRFDFPKTLRLIQQVADRWCPRKIGIESVGYQKAVPQALRQSWSYPVVEVPHNTSKFMRAQMLVGKPAESGKLHFLGLPAGDGREIHQSQKLLWDELIMFGSGQHDDLADALGIAMQMAIGGPRGNIRFL